MFEAKYLMQPVEISLPGPTPDRTIRAVVSGPRTCEVKLRFKNRYSFSDLSHLIWTWEVVSNRSTSMLASGEMNVTLPANETEHVCINLDGVIDEILRSEKTTRSKNSNSYFLNIQGALRNATVWATAGHVLVQEQFPLELSFGNEDDTTLLKSSALENQSLLSTEDKDGMITVFRRIATKAIPYLVINKATGLIVTITSSEGDNLIAPNHCMAPQFTRATTDNDRGGMERILSFFYPDSGLEQLWSTVFGTSTFSYHTRWRMAGLNLDYPPHQSCSGIRVSKSPDNKRVEIAVTIITKSAHRKKELVEQKIVYKTFGDGRICVTSHVVPRPALQGCVSLPRIGMSLALNKSLYNIQYFGRGPFENYEDRKVAARMGVFETTPKEMAYHYIFPSENGSRSDCEWVALRNSNGVGICFASDGVHANGKRNKFHFSALLHSSSEYHSASHTCDLQKRENGEHSIYMNLDHKLMGLGGDLSWLPCVYDEYLVNTNQEYSFGFWIIPLNERNDAASIAIDNVTG